ncbi:MAG: superoxide dismutase [Patescibacteria group bacterium]|nr:superoxide dismutase [Patescibacteria group bacterium]
MSLNFFNISYDKKDLEPFLSVETLEFHHEKHHRAYFDNLSKLIVGTELEDKSLEEIILFSFSKKEMKSIYNNAAQVFNHDFYFKSLKKNIKPSDGFLKIIDNSFGSWSDFKEEFKTKALAQFGSGWTWLVVNDNKLDIVSTSNADNPLTLGMKPLMTIDVWEHAYYIDYRNVRGDYISALLDNLIDWVFVESNYELVD